MFALTLECYHLETCPHLYHLAYQIYETLFDQFQRNNNLKATGWDIRPRRCSINPQLSELWTDWIATWKNINVSMRGSMAYNDVYKLTRSPFLCAYCEYFCLPFIIYMFIHYPWSTLIWIQKYRGEQSIVFISVNWSISRRQKVHVQTDLFLWY